MPAGVSAITPIANTTLSNSTTATVTFSSIVGTYRDLVLVIQGSTTGNANVRMRFNGDSGTNYAFVFMAGAASQQVSGVATSQDWMYANYYANWDTTQANIVVNFLDYAQTDKHKMVTIRDNAASTYTETIAGRWPSTSAITSIAINASGLFASGTSFSLYGVSA
jgi:hypothetical protein